MSTIQRATLHSTEVHQLRSGEIGQDYEVSVAGTRSYLDDNEFPAGKEHRIQFRRYLDRPIFEVNETLRIRF